MSSAVTSIIPHGLGVIPDFITVKGRLVSSDATSNGSWDGVDQKSIYNIASGSNGNVDITNAIHMEQSVAASTVGNIAVDDTNITITWTQGGGGVAGGGEFLIDAYTFGGGGSGGYELISSDTISGSNAAGTAVDTSVIPTGTTYILYDGIGYEIEGGNYSYNLRGQISLMPGIQDSGWVSTGEVPASGVISGFQASISGSTLTCETEGFIAGGGGSTAVIGGNVHYFRTGGGTSSSDTYFGYETTVSNETFTGWGFDNFGSYPDGVASTPLVFYPPNDGGGGGSGGKLYYADEILDATNDFDISFICAANVLVNSNSFTLGIGDAAGATSPINPADTVDGAWIKVGYNAVEASTSDGSSNTTTDITGATVLTDFNKYRILRDGVNVKFYINDVLATTHTTNLPIGTGRSFWMQSYKTNAATGADDATNLLKASIIYRCPF